MNILNFCFEKIYVINISTNSLRKNSVKKELDGMDFEFLEAIVPEHIKDKKTQQICGNRLSHLSAIKKAKYLNYKNVLVLEDDIIFDNRINYDYIMRESKDFLNNDKWACFYLGGKARNNLRFSNNITNHIKPIKSMIGTHAIAYNQEFYDDIIECLNNDSLMPIDYYYAGPPNNNQNTGFCHSHNCYSIYPKFIVQRTGTNVNGKSITDNYWKDF
jgi:GR25 family glycosyltransferase involved in LPS biosynthesis